MCHASESYVSHMCKRIFKFELQLSRYWQNTKFLPYCPQFHILYSNFSSIFANFLDRLLHPINFIARTCQECSFSFLPVVSRKVFSAITKDSRIKSHKIPILFVLFWCRSHAPKHHSLWILSGSYHSSWSLHVLLCFAESDAMLVYYTNIDCSWGTLYKVTPRGDWRQWAYYISWDEDIFRPYLCFYYELL